MASSLIVIPTYDEKENVRPLAAAIHERVPDTHILFVDDNSPDGTGALLDEMAADDRIFVLHREKKSGLGRAYIAGFQWALKRDYQYVLEMDADFSHDPAELPTLLDAITETDLALGSRYVDGIRVINWPLNRLILSKGAGVYVRLITGMPFTDPTGGFKCYRRSILETLNLDQITSNGYCFQVEMTHQAWMRGFHITDVPITFVERRMGESKMSQGIVREALWLVWKLLFRCKGKRSPSGVHPLSVCAPSTPPSS